jgi:hypothetical protein
MRKVPGYLTSLDAVIIRWLLSWQESLGIHGNLCEIGAHHGRLFFLLALWRKAGESALAIDLFEDDNLNVGVHAGRAESFKHHALRLGIELSPAEVMKGSSLDISAEQILERAGGPIRLFSVDGGHMYQHVENDLRLARQCLCSQGIVAVDDFFNLGWPEVTFATYDFLRACPELVPVIASQKKLYLVHRDFAACALDFARSTPLPGTILEFPIMYLGNRVVQFRGSKVERIKQGIRNLM